MPSINVPIGKEHFNTGFGSSASLDWVFLPITNRWKAGLGLTGNIIEFPVNLNNPFSIIGAGLGPFVQWQISDRFSSQVNANTGIYQYSMDDTNNIKMFAGAAISAQFHITPVFSLFAETGLTWHSFSDNQAINNLKSGIGIHINLGELLRPEVRLSVEKTEQHMILPVIFAWYENNDFAVLRVTNQEPNAITNIKLSFLLERYMNQAYTFALIERLGPGESLEVPVTALFNESMLDLTETVNSPVRIFAEYRSHNMRKTKSFQMEMQVFHRNAMTWDDDRRAAAFVSGRDPAAVYFARYATSAIGNLNSRNLPANVIQAAALFEALRLYGINYIIDPTSSYIELSGNPLELDNINFPYETLHYRGGDCDDLSILFASMLEALNIESAFITVPGHIYVAFDIGDDNWRKGHNDIIENAGRRWMPVEVTVPARGFTEATRTGALQWRRAGNEAQIYPMRENWLAYPSVSVSAAGNNLPSMPDRSAIARSLEAELDRLR